jgi:hypothetical protein
MWTRGIFTPIFAGLMVAGVACNDAKDAEKRAEAAQAKAMELAAQAQEAAKKAQEAAAAAHAAAGEAADEAGGAEDAPKNLQDAVARMEQAMKAQIGTGVEPVDFRALKDLLPESAGGLKRTKASGNKSGMAGVKISMAEGRYEGEGGASMTLKVVDMGSMKGFAAMAATSWAAVEIDQESDEGYEKTTKFEGYRAYEKAQGDRTELKVVVGDRFMVEANGRQVKMDALKAAAKALDLPKLAELK